MIGTYNENTKDRYDLCFPKWRGRVGGGTVFSIVQTCKYIIGYHSYYRLLLYLFEETFLICTLICSALHPVEIFSNFLIKKYMSYFVHNL